MNLFAAVLSTNSKCLGRLYNVESVNTETRYEIFKSYILNQKENLTISSSYTFIEWKMEASVIHNTVYYLIIHRQLLHKQCIFLRKLRQ